MSWPVPTFPGEDVFLQFCKDHDLSASQREELSGFIQELIDASGQFLSEIKFAKTYKQSRADMETAVAKIDSILKLLEGFNLADVFQDGERVFHFHNIPGWDIIRKTVSSRMTQQFSPRFLVEIAKQVPPNSSDSHDYDRSWTANVVRANPSAVLIRVLEVLRMTFFDVAIGMKARTPKGGPAPNDFGRWIVVNLAGAYHRLNAHEHSTGNPPVTRRTRKPSRDPNGPFGRFVKDLVDAMGLPTQWIDRQLRLGVSDWKCRTGQNPR